MNLRTHSCLPLLMAAATVAIACLGAAGACMAAERDPDDAALTKAFWDCDVSASREATSTGDGAVCVMLTDALKERHFGGDFLRLLAWWREQRQFEYARRDVPLPESLADEPALQAP